MEVLFGHQVILITVLKAVISLFCLFLLVIMAFYNLLYLSRIHKSTIRIGLHPPQHIHHLVKTSILIPFFTVIFIIIFLVTGLY